MGRLRIGRLVFWGCLWLAVGTACRASDFEVGVFADTEHTLSCLPFGGPAERQMVLWAHLPPDEGLAYVTVRFRFPDNLRFSHPPELHPAARFFIETPFPGGSEEWNIVFDGCPGDWVPVLARAFELLDGEPSVITIAAEHSMLRDCDFTLNDVLVISELSLNDPECQEVSAAPRTWGGLKARYRLPDG